MAGLSMLDMASDLMMIFRYSSNDETSLYAYATTCAVIFSIIIQSIVIFIAYKKFPWYKQLKEQAILFTLVKPGLDAYRFVNNTKQEAGSIVDAGVEMTIQRTIDMVFESIPVVR